MLFLLSLLFINTSFASTYDTLIGTSCISDIKVDVSKVKIAVLDTGIDKRHPHFQLTNLSGASLVPEPWYSDDVGHGTHVAGILASSRYGLVPLAHLFIVRYITKKTNVVDSVIDGIRAAILNDVQVINFSGGGPAFSQEEKDVIIQARNKNITIVTVAGNEGANIDDPERSYYPASYATDNMIVVSAMNENAELTKTSSYGKRLSHIAAPGYMVESSHLNGTIKKMSGTSMAAPYVTAAVALIKAHNPKSSNLRVTDILSLSSKRVPTLKGKVKFDGYLDFCLLKNQLTK